MNLEQILNIVGFIVMIVCIIGAGFCIYKLVKGAIK